ncbi:hypothetical protein M0657_000667 [Pyricularia oryzae]|uniref:Uncharacterized protein n=1 Tax=Pyricularia oryzae TaxID=318829 RepID=A0A4P7N4D0_PYROR|nr:hypothetical protein M9X92_002508 [Pyricularia oryzae]KAI7932228.1 hypothetical protein M0657_000667 [Pyricularia oryzae]QBZ57358.1 hypothetical protein PoMZ_02282 [Pyricularia oryzae]
MFGRAAKPSNPLLQPTSKLGELENPSIVTTHVASGFWGSGPNARQIGRWA